TANRIDLRSMAFGKDLIRKQDAKQILFGIKPDHRSGEAGVTKTFRAKIFAAGAIVIVYFPAKGPIGIGDSILFCKQLDSRCLKELLSIHFSSFEIHKSELGQIFHAGIKSGMAKDSPRQP